MIIIYGMRHWNWNSEPKGQFHCPQCGGPRTWSECHESSWFSLYWIPIIPCGSQRLGVQCAGCESIFDDAVLHLTADQVVDPAQPQYAQSALPYDQSPAYHQPPASDYPPPLPGKWNCPSCGLSQPSHYERCPVCQVRRDGTAA